jgi:hypothetical protein
MHRMIASGLRTLYIKQKRMTVFSLSVSSLLFQYRFTRRLRLLEFQQSFALHFVFYIEEKAKILSCSGVRVWDCFCRELHYQNEVKNKRANYS